MLPVTTLLQPLTRLATRLALWRVAEVGEGVQLLGRVYIHGGGRITLGRDVVLDGRALPIELHAGPDGTLVIGDGTVIHSGASIEAQERVEIGPRCVLGRLSKVMDNHFHPVGGDRHQRPSSKPVILEAGVTLAPRAIVLPGAHLEANVQVGPGVVVSRRVKAGLSLVGSPPRVVRAAS